MNGVQLRVVDVERRNACTERLHYLLINCSLRGIVERDGKKASHEAHRSTRTPAAGGYRCDLVRNTIRSRAIN